MRSISQVFHHGGGCIIEISASEDGTSEIGAKHGSETGFFSLHWNICTKNTRVSHQVTVRYVRMIDRNRGTIRVWFPLTDSTISNNLIFLARLFLCVTPIVRLASDKGLTDARDESRVNVGETR